MTPLDRALHRPLRALLSPRWTAPPARIADATSPELSCRLQAPLPAPRPSGAPPPGPLCDEGEAGPQTGAHGRCMATVEMDAPVPVLEKPGGGGGVLLAYESCMTPLETFPVTIPEKTPVPDKPKAGFLIGTKVHGRSPLLCLEEPDDARDDGRTASRAGVRLDAIAEAGLMRAEFEPPVRTNMGRSKEHGEGRGPRSPWRAPDASAADGIPAGSGRAALRLGAALPPLDIPDTARGRATGGVSPSHGWAMGASPSQGRVMGAFSPARAMGLSPVSTSLHAERGSFKILSPEMLRGGPGDVACFLARRSEDAGVGVDTDLEAADEAGGGGGALFAVSTVPVYLMSSVHRAGYFDRKASRVKAAHHRSHSANVLFARWACAAARRRVWNLS
jgi:hypothetical protein